jgi:hypothetical protein
MEIMTGLKYHPCRHTDPGLKMYFFTLLYLERDLRTSEAVTVTDGGTIPEFSTSLLKSAKPEVYNGEVNSKRL